MSKRRSSHGKNRGRNRKKKNTGLWVAIACLSVAAVAGIVLCAYGLLGASGQSKDYNHYINLAQRYASEERYEEAVEQYWVAINLDETQEAAYLGLGELYEETQQTYNAMNIYSLGYQRTSSEVLNDRYLTISRLVNPDSPLENQVDKNLEMTILINQTLFGRFSGYGLEQYTQTYGEPEIRSLSNVPGLRTTGTVAEVRCPNLNAVLYFYNTESDDHVLDAAGRPGNNQIPAEIVVGDLSQIFVGMEGKITYEELSDASLGLEELRKEHDSSLNRYVVRFRLSGCQVVIETDEEGTIQSESAWNRIYPMAHTHGENGSAAVSGQVVSAVDGRGVMDAELTLVSVETGEVVQETTSDADGSYAFEEIPEGDYVIKVSAENYLSDKFQVSLNAADDNSDKLLIISPLLGEGEIRFVLSWEGSPSDLDSYLVGTASDGSDMMISYYNKQCYDKNGQLTAELDVDDTDGYGPETITLKDVGGSYEMVVVDYNTTGTMGSTDATVRIYTADGETIEVKVNPGVQNIWHVCTVENGKVDVQNRAGDDSELSSGSK